MARQVINIGSSPNKGDGEPLRIAFDKVNSNFEELYAATTAGGAFVGDVTGSVFADDSTLLVDGVSGTIPGYVSVSELQAVFAAATDFTDLKSRIAGL
jgi:hypothetical protein